MGYLWDMFDFSTSETARDCPQGSIYVDETDDGLLRIQVIGGRNDGYTAYANPSNA